VGVFITPAGLAAINAGDGEGAAASETTSDTDVTMPRTTKVSAVVALLERDEGATRARRCRTSSQRRGGCLDRLPSDRG